MIQSWFFWLLVKKINFINQDFVSMHKLTKEKFILGESVLIIFILWDLDTINILAEIESINDSDCLV